MNPQKKIVIIAGPNEAGKSTISREYLPFVVGCSNFRQFFDNGCDTSPLVDDGGNP